MVRALILAGVVCLAGPQVKAGLIIDYTGPAQYQSAFDAAEAQWEALVNGYQNGTAVARSSGSSISVGETLRDLIITASVVPIDGVGRVLGRAGPTAVIVDQLGFTLATDGIMEFDVDDVASLDASGSLEAVVLHEMAHVMGFGTLWTDNNVYIDGTGEYTGAAATAKWQSEFGQPGTPDVELGGGPGTANGHWNEVNGGGGLTGIKDAQGRDMRDELMTGWLNPNSFISEMTIASFRDIGLTAVPEPSSLVACAAALGLLMQRRRRVGYQLAA